MATLGQLAASNMRHLRSLNIGYSQPRRWNIWQGGTTDCSASTARAYNMTGLIAPFPEDLRTWTGTWRALAADRGFTVTAWDGDTADLREGDLLLSEEASGGTGHIAMITYPGVVSEWWGSETGDTDGADGDQTGQEGREKEIDIHPFTLSGNWTHVLRPPAITDGAEGAAATTITTDEEDDMFTIIKAPGRDHALIGPNTYLRFTREEQLKVALRVLPYRLKDDLNPREYDVAVSTILESTLDAERTAALLAQIKSAVADRKN